MEKKKNVIIRSLSVLSVDQTPTPTRLIRNCEEVGLFDDLQQVNPFDETFRRAAEANFVGDRSAPCDSTKPKLTTQTTLEALTLHNEETLHTPNVLPYSELAATNKNLQTTISLDDDMLQPIDHCHLISTPYIISTQCMPSSPKIAAKPLKQLCPKKVAVVDDPIKEKLKQMFKRAKESTKTKFVARPERSQQRKHSGSEKNTATASNRAAAQRYRVKVKKNQTLLEQRNAKLEAENEKLRTELKSIKAILQSHQDCSVTRALSQRIYTEINAGLGPSIYYVVDANYSNSGKSKM